MLRVAPILGALLAAAAVSSAAGRTLELANFGRRAFDTTFDHFTQTREPGGVRLSSPEGKGWGGAVAVQRLDLASYRECHVVVALQTLRGNRASHLDFELEDVDGRAAKWTLRLASSKQNAQTTQIHASTTLAMPTHGNGDWQNLDLARIANWKLLGTWDGADRIDVRAVRVLLTDEEPLGTPYRGAEPDAPWRREAAQRIDAIRKAPLIIQVVDSEGNNVPKAVVEVRQVRQEFLFGSAVVAHRLVDALANPTELQENSQYRRRFVELFNAATLENALKWLPWENNLGQHSQQVAIDAVAWLRDRDIAVRGHALVWPGRERLPRSLQRSLDETPWSVDQQRR
ncbi:MAG: endo-1,4-beta-xylanase, partial [Planctomycetales bacterium]|nr:endo-1,4-beta-xylanase [Planctomycetales bacterium]